MSELTDLEEIRANLLARIKEVTASPAPNYNIDGQSISWQSYLDSLWAKYHDIKTEINAADPFEEVSQGCT